MILYGKEVADVMYNATKNRVAKLETKPKLLIIANDQDTASKVYVANKVNKCKECGIEALVIPMKENATEEDYLKAVDYGNKVGQITGIIVQLPTPQGINANNIISKIAPEKDIDGLTPNSKFIPCTPVGIVSLINYYKGSNWLEGKKAVVIGRSELVGKPLAELLTNKNATVTLCHSKTPDLKFYTQNADLIVSAVGKPNLLTRDMVKWGATIIDVGINRVNGKLCGDCDFEKLKDICDISPVPGGVGIMTVATLVSRLPYMAKKQNQKEELDFC